MEMSCFNEDYVLEPDIFRMLEAYYLSVIAGLSHRCITGLVKCHLYTANIVYYAGLAARENLPILRQVHFIPSTWI